MADAVPVLSLRGVVKDFHGLRPLRVQELELFQAEVLSVAGLDLAAAEVLTNLVTGASLPDAGEVRVDGSSTREIADPDAWLSWLDRFGIISHRVVLLEEFTVAENIAVPLTLELRPLPDAVAAAVGRLAAEVALPVEALRGGIGSAPPSVRLRTRLARAVALEPRLLIVEHPTDGLEAAETSSFARDLERIVRARAIAALVLTADSRLSGSMRGRRLALEPASGRLRPQRGWRLLG